MKISIEQILDWGPCELYDTREKIIERTDADWPKTPLEIADLNIPIRDILWVLLRSEIINKKSLQLLACDFAEHVLPVYETRYPDDNRPHKATETMRLWIAGETGPIELIFARTEVYAAANAAYCAVVDVAVVYANAAYAAAAAYAATYAASAAAGAAARATGTDEQAWQLKRVKEVLKESV